MDDTAKLINERGKTHGDYRQQGGLAYNLKRMFRANANGLSPHQHDAIDMILVKVSRIACGDASEPDHWDDIAGYAKLGKPE